MPRIWVYEATKVPRYRLVADEWAIINNLIAQRAFLGSTLLSLCSPLQGSLEFRFRTDIDGRVRIFIAIEIPDGVDAKQRDSGIRVTERLLPQGYAWTRSNVQSLDGELQGRPIRIARIVRSIEFIDLPPTTLAAVGNLVPEPATSRSSTIGNFGQTSQAKAPNESPTLGIYPRQLRDLPPLFVAGQKLNQLRLCLPLLGPLSPWRAEARTLLDELVASRPAIISIHLRPTFPGELDQALPAAAFWRLCLKDYLGEIAGTGIADPKAIIGNYARYGLPPGQLSHISLRCGALNDLNAMAVASVLAASLGGARTYSVCPPSDDRPLASLRNIWADYPKEPLRGNQADLWKGRALAAAREANVADPQDNESLDLLARAPHLYTFDEIEVLAQLPVSGEDGLPGLETEMVPPFYGDLPFGANSSSAPLGTPAANTKQPKDNIRIGRQSDRQGLRGEEMSVWHHMPLNDLSKHALIVGSTGSGKTVVASFLLTEIARSFKPFLVIEPVKTEYYGRLKKYYDELQNDRKSQQPLRRYHFEGDDHGMPADDFLPFDPLYLQPRVTVSRHAACLKSCFEAAFPLDAVSALILENGIRQYYIAKTDHACGLELFSRGGPSIIKNGRRTVLLKGIKGPNQYKLEHCNHPSLHGFMSFFLYNFLPETVRANASGGKLSELLDNWTQMFARRFDAIESGMLGIAARKAQKLYNADPANYDPFAPLINGPVVLELDGIADDEQKSLMMAFIFTFLFERRQADDFFERKANIPKADLKHVLVIEEAHRLLANVSITERGDVVGLGAKAKSVSAFVDMLAEVRIFGQGLVIVEQIPTKIVTEAVKNTNLKIMLRLTAADDREYLGSAMNLTEDQKRFVTSLRADEAGVSMVVFEQQSDQPRLLKLSFDS